MAQAVRSYATAGIAVAGLIAAVPGLPARSDVQVPSAQLFSDSIALMSVGQVAGDVGSAVGAMLAGNPGSGFLTEIITPYENLVTNFINNAVAIDGNWVLADPLPLSRQFLENLVGYGQSTVPLIDSAINQFATGLDNLPSALQTIFSDLSTGNISDATQALYAAVASITTDPLSALAPIAQIPVEMSNNFGNAVDVLSTAAPYLLSSALAPVHNAVVETEAIAQTISADITGGNALGAFTTLVGAPGSILDAAFNETFFGGATGYAVDGQGMEIYPGLFVPYDPEGGMPYSGLDALVKQLGQLVATAIATPQEFGYGIPGSAVDPLGFGSAWLGDITQILDGHEALANLLPDLVHGLLTAF